MTQTVQRRTLSAILSMGVREFAVKTLAFVGWIVLARLLDPPIFGIFAVASFALNLFVLLSEVGLGASLVRQPEVSNDDLNGLFTYQLIWATPLALLAITASALLAAPLALGNLTPVIQALAVSFLLIAFRTSPSIIAQRKLAYAPIVVSDVASQIAYWVTAIGAALAGWGLWSVVVSAIAFSFVNTVVLYARVGWLPALSARWRGIHGGAGFSVLYQSQQGASLAKYAMLPILGGLSAGGAGVGYVTWAHQIAVIPIQLTQLISRVSFPALARLQHDPAAFAATLRAILKWTCLITFPACALLVGLGPQIIDFVYGPKWQPALIPFYIFAVNTALNAPVGVLTPALYSLGKGGRGFRVLIFMLALTWIAGIALAFAGVGIEAPAVAFLAGMIGALYLVVLNLRDFGGFSLLLPLVRPAASGVCGAGLLQLIAPTLVHDLVTLVTVGGAVLLLMLAVNLWGNYTSLLSQAKSFLDHAPKPQPREDAQDAGIGSL